MAQYHARKRDIKVKPVVKVVDCFAKDKKDKKQKFACKDCSFVVVGWWYGDKSTW